MTDHLSSAARFCGAHLFQNVEIRRLSIPEEEIIGTSHGAGMFTKGSESLQMLKMKAENAEGVDMGSDAGLETKILDQIEQRLKN